ncbi:MAG: hypothetical protein J7498_02080 [Sphingobium sp.]|nr:hypothetical protein [Sphingobium sp.]
MDKLPKDWPRLAVTETAAILRRQIEHMPMLPTISLTRDEALLALALVETLELQLAKEAARENGTARTEASSAGRSPRAAPGDDLPP